MNTEERANTFRGCALLFLGWVAGCILAGLILGLVLAVVLFVLGEI